jgi:hypothetical protein
MRSPAGAGIVWQKSRQLPERIARTDRISKPRFLRETFNLADFPDLSIFKCSQNFKNGLTFDFRLSEKVGKMLDYC